MSKISNFLRESAFWIIHKYAFKNIYRIENYYKNYKNELDSKLFFDSVGYYGRGCRLNGTVDIQYPSGLIINDNVHIGGNCYFHALGGIFIGSNTHISRNVTIYSANHDYKGHLLPFDEDFKLKPVFIEKNVWIGMNVCIKPGVKIGEGAIIGMGSIISNDVMPFEIIGPKLQDSIASRDEQHYRLLEDQSKFSGLDGKEIAFNISKKDVLNLRKVFFVSTGRSGSKSLSEIFQQNGKVASFHEHLPVLIQESNKVLYNSDNLKTLEKYIERAYSSILLPDEKEVYCDSDQKLVPLVKFMSTKFPDSKFVWIIRDPYSFVNSAYNRGWFTNKELGYESTAGEKDFLFSTVYSKNRVNGHRVGAFDESEWMNLSAFERICWYWKYWNKLIEDQLKSLDKQRWMLVDLGNLETRINEIGKFVSEDDFKYHTVQANRASYGLDNLSEWEPEKKMLVEKWCSEYYSHALAQYEG